MQDSASAALVVVRWRTAVWQNVERAAPFLQGDVDRIEAEPFEEGDETVRSLEEPQRDFFFVFVPAASRHKQLLNRSVFGDSPNEPLSIPDGIFSECWGFTYNLSLIPLLQEDPELRLCNHIRRFFV